MATTEPHLHSILHTSMGEDSMEVVSDPGRFLDGDDIDIDIDFTNDEHDEDLIIEDVEIGTGYQDITDDVMVDDDEVSYHMDDAIDEHDLLDAEHIHMEDAQIEDIEEVQPIDAVQDDPVDRSHLFVEGIQDEGSEIGWDEPDQLVDVPITEVQQWSHESDAAEVPIEAIPHVTESGTESQLPRDITDIPQSDEAPLEVTKVSENGVAYEQISPTHTTIVEGNSHESQSENPGRSSGDSTTSNGIGTENKPGITQDQSTEEIPALTEGSNQRAADLPEVYVLYQDVEYSLIGASDNDNPDSYFFKDDTAVNAGLITFFYGLREILYNDIPDHHELCLVIEDLAIEISETTASQHHVTFAQLVQLHADLKRNDDSQDRDAVFVTLSTRMNFIERVNTLLAGAAEGKGLSEFVDWEGDSIDDTEQEKHTDEEVRNYVELDGSKVEDAEQDHVKLGESAVEDAEQDPVDYEHVADVPASEELAEPVVSDNEVEITGVQVEDEAQPLGKKHDEKYDEKSTHVHDDAEAVEPLDNNEDDLIDYEEDDTGEPAPTSNGHDPPSNENSSTSPSSSILKLDSHATTTENISDSVPHKLNTSEQSPTNKAVGPHDDHIENEQGTSDFSENSDANVREADEPDKNIAKPDLTTLEGPQSNLQASYDGRGTILDVVEDEIGYEDEIDETPLASHDKEEQALDTVDDEIGYDDDDDEDVESIAPVTAESAPSISFPASNGKRSHAELDNAVPATEQQDSKRLRI